MMTQIINEELSKRNYIKKARGKKEEQILKDDRIEKKLERENE